MLSLYSGNLNYSTFNNILKLINIKYAFNVVLNVLKSSTSVIYMNKSFEYL